MTSQREWELETKIKHLEGGGLDNLIANHKVKITGIFADAIDQLDELERDLKIGLSVGPSDAGYWLQRMLEEEQDALLNEAFYLDMGP